MNRSARRVLLRLFLLALPLVVLTLFATSLLTNSNVDSVHNHNALTFASEGKQISLISRAPPPLETRLELLSFFLSRTPRALLYSYGEMVDSFSYIYVFFMDFFLSQLVFRARTAHPALDKSPSMLKRSSNM